MMEPQKTATLGPRARTRVMTGTRWRKRQRTVRTLDQLFVVALSLIILLLFLLAADMRRGEPDEDDEGRKKKKK